MIFTSTALEALIIGGLWIIGIADALEATRAKATVKKALLDTLASPMERVDCNLNLDRFLAKPRASALGLGT
jgi:hypothetical protein